MRPSSSRFSFALIPPSFLSILLLLTTACSGNKGAQASAPQAMPVQVKTAQPAKVNDTTEYVATLKSRDTAVIMPQVEGIITQIFVHSGQHVGAGTPLIQIDPAKQQATLKNQEDARAAQLAQVKWAQQNYDRVSGLANAGVVSRQDLDQARATRDAAQAQYQALDAAVREQQVQLHYYQVVASRAGIVGHPGAGWRPRPDHHHTHDSGPPRNSRGICVHSGGEERAVEDQSTG